MTEKGKARMNQALKENSGCWSLPRRKFMPENDRRECAKVEPNWVFGYYL